MLINIVIIAVLIYFSGMLFFVDGISKSWHVYSVMSRSDDPPFTIKEMRDRFIIAPIVEMVIWPLRVFILGNPVDLLHTIFGLYGRPQPGIRNYNGLKSFWYDIVKGKDRYLGYSVYFFSVVIKELSPDLINLPGITDFNFVTITLYIKDKHILCQACYSEEENVMNEPDLATRFQMDGYIHTNSFEKLASTLNQPGLTPQIFVEKVNKLKPFIITKNK